MTDLIQDIAKMHTKFGVNKTADTLTGEQLRTYLKFRIDMVQEEVTELKDAFDEGDAEGVVDALIDAIVFALGTLDVFGVDSAKAWTAVMDANMAKEPGVKASRPNPFGFPDLIKPEGWTGPSHEANHGRIPEAL